MKHIFVSITLCIITLLFPTHIKTANPPLEQSIWNEFGYYLICIQCGQVTNRIEFEFFGHICRGSVSTRQQPAIAHRSVQQESSGDDS